MKLINKTIAATKVKEKANEEAVPVVTGGITLVVG